MKFKELLETKPIGLYENVEDVLVNSFQRYSNGEKIYIAYPDLELFCNYCKGERSFVREMYPYTFGDPEIEIDYPYAYIFEYVCSNCKNEMKYFALKIDQIGESENADVYKIGEYPPRISNLPSKLLSLFGPNKDLLIKAKTCENSGLGIGAFTYYRRIVEDQRNRLYDLIIKTIQRIDNDEEKIKLIQKAKNEIQFSKSIELVKSAIPDQMIINGHNPLKLLHSAMSKGVHNLSDQECLELAESIRLVLTEMIDRMDKISKDELQLKQAINKLNKL